MTVLIALALFPSLTFFASGIHDPNHRQQLFISILAVVLSGMSITIVPSSWRSTLQPALILIATAVGIWSLTTALDLMSKFTETAQPGAGGLMFILLLITFVAKNRRGNSWRATP